MTALEDAFKRYEQLALALKRMQDAVTAQPSNQDFLDVSLTEKGTPISDARKKANVVFDNLQIRIQHLAVLDMCSTFEELFSQRVGTAIGSARNAVSKQYKSGPFSKYSSHLVRNRESFDSLASMFFLLKGKVSDSNYDRLELLRRQRNLLSHGGNLNRPLDIDLEETKNLLIEAAEELWK